MRHDEDDLQMWCVTYLTYRYSHLVWNHSPNEGERTAKQGAKLKKMGMRRGWPDLDIYDGDKVVHVEFKTPTGRQRPEQKAVQELIEKQGGTYLICRTREQFQEICRGHFGEERDPDAERLREILSQ